MGKPEGQPTFLVNGMIGVSESKSERISKYRSSFLEGNPVFP